MLDIIEKYINKNMTTDYDKLYNLLINKFKTDIEIAEIKYIMYDKFSYIVQNKLLHKVRDEQHEFREKIISLDECCIISGDDHEQCQACHIIPVCESGTYNTNNGILLNYNLHNMFDKYKLGIKFIKNIDKTYDLYNVILSNTIKNNDGYNNYKIYDNKEIKIRKECYKNLKVKYDQFSN
jgi:hypothetical protein